MNKSMTGPEHQPQMDGFHWSQPPTIGHCSRCATPGHDLRRQRRQDSQILSRIANCCRERIPKVLVHRIELQQGCQRGDRWRWPHTKAWHYQPPLKITPKQIGGGPWAKIGNKATSTKTATMSSRKIHKLLFLAQKERIICTYCECW